MDSMNVGFQFSLKNRSFDGIFKHCIQILPFPIATFSGLIGLFNRTDSEMRKHFIQTISHEDFSSFGTFNVLFHAQNALIHYNQSTNDPY